jgi:hypothetical protein
VWLIVARRVQSERKAGRYGGAKSALAGLLALLLLAAATVSANHALHHFLHQDGGVNQHLCLVCSFAKGQVSAAEATLVAAALIVGFSFDLCRANILVLPAVDFRLSPSRAPPGA